MARAERQITIGLEKGGAEPRGLVSAPGEPDRPFSGWIAMVAALESAIRALPFEEQAKQEEGADDA